MVWLVRLQREYQTSSDTVGGASSPKEAYKLSSCRRVMRNPPSFTVP